MLQRVEPYVTYGYAKFHLMKSPDHRGSLSLSGWLLNTCKLISGTLIWRVSGSWSTRGVTEKLSCRELRWPTTLSLNRSVLFMFGLLFILLSLNVFVACKIYPLTLYSMADPRKAWDYLHWGSDPWDIDCWTSLQGGKQLLVAFQAQSSPGWLEEEKKSLCWRWWCWQQGGLHKWTY